MFNAFLVQIQFCRTAVMAFFCFVASAAHAETTPVSAKDFMKIRCNTLGETSTTTWNGNVTTTGIGSEKPQTLFKIAGFNVARCLADDAGNWMVTSREMTFYLDPATGEILRQWKNPWTGEPVPVVHIANALVQQRIPASMQLNVESLGDTSILRIDVPLSYPNPLAGATRFTDYSPEATYKAHESFSYVLSRNDVRQLSTVDSVAQVQVSWTRVSPWIPWMRMKGAAGQLVFSAIVKKLEKGEPLPEFFKQEIQRSGTQIYLDAPRCIVKNKPNVSSWTYFKDNFDKYAMKAIFPVPEPASIADTECGGL